MYIGDVDYPQPNSAEAKRTPIVSIQSTPAQTSSGKQNPLQVTTCVEYSDKGNQRTRDATSRKCQTEGTVETRTGRTGEEAEGHVLGG